jgi:hypothetical protein
MKHPLFIVCFCLIVITVRSQVLSDDENKLYELMMTYRRENGLSRIPLSSSLTFVAQTHVKDLAHNKPDLGSCNAHSWSSKGNWSACCYTEDHAQARLMWSKPAELTSYKGYGYEIACGSNGCCSSFIMTAEYALSSWKSSSGHNAVIINKGMWNRDWKAVGIGIYKGFAAVWFGHESDDQ